MPSRRHRSPKIMSLVLLPGGEVVRGTTDQQLSTDVDAAEGWTLSSALDTLTISSSRVDGRSFDLVLSAPADPEEPLVGVYDAEAGELVNTAGFGVEGGTFDVTGVAPAPAPELVSATLAADGVTLVLVFSHPFTAGDGETGFSVEVEEAAATVDSGSVGTDEDANVVTLVLAAAALEDDEVSVSYDADTGDMEGAHYPLASFTDAAVDNNSEQTE